MLEQLSNKTYTVCKILCNTATLICSDKYPIEEINNRNVRGESLMITSVKLIIISSRAPYFMALLRPHEMRNVPTFKQPYKHTQIVTN